MSPLLEQDLAALRSQLFATVPEAARVLRSDPRSVRRAIERDELPAVRFGSVIRVPTAALFELAGLAPDCANAEPAGPAGPASASTSPMPGRGLTDDHQPQHHSAANVARVTGL